MSSEDCRGALSNSRREFLRRSAVLLAGASMSGVYARGQAPEPSEWSMLPAILKRIKPPAFPDRAFDIARHGAVSGGEADCTEAIARAIEACNRAGGGRVVVPAGVFLTGAVHLKSNVNLHLSAGATLRFSRDPRRYLPAVFTRWEGTECMNYSPFIYAYGQENIAVTGEGTLDGQADCQYWWPWKGRTDCGWRKGDPSQQKARDRLMEMGEKDVPARERVFGEGHYLRPQFLQPCRCKNVLIEGVTIRNSPMWEIHPLLCSNVTVRGVKVISHGPNNDGCDPESCTDVLIEKCQFDTGDDCIAIKSGRNRDGRRVAVASENIVVRGCEMKDGHGGVTIGSEVSGNVRNVFVEDCRMDSPNLERVLRIKTNAVRGGIIERIFMRDVAVGQVADAVVSADFYYEEGAAGSEKPVVREVVVSRVTCRKSKYALYLRAFPGTPMRGIRLEDCAFESVSHKDVVENVEGLVLKNVRVNGQLVERT